MTNDSLLLTRYFGQAIQDARSFLWDNAEKFGIKILDLQISSGLPEKQAEKAFKKFPLEIPELKELFSATQSVFIELNPEEFVGKFSPFIRAEIPNFSRMAKNIHKDSSFYWDINFETGEGEIKYFEDLGLKGKALKEFKQKLPKLYNFDIFAEGDAYVLLWIHEEKYGLLLVTSQGENVKVLPWSIGEYLKYLALTLGLSYWQKFALEYCSDKDIACLISEALNYYEYSEEIEKRLQEFFNEYHKIVADVPSVLMKSYISPFKKTTEEVREKIRELLQNENANPNIPFGDRETPLIRATRLSDFPLINLLLDFGADPSIKAPSGVSVSDILLDRSKKDLPTFVRLVEKGAPITQELVPKILAAKFISKKKYTDNPGLKTVIEKMIDVADEETLQELIQAIKKLKDTELLQKAEARL